MNIDTAADSIDCSDVFHIVTDVIGYILFMHQQIPSLLQDITCEFDGLRTEFEELEVDLAKSEGISKLARRNQAARKREVKMGIRRLEKLVNCISDLKTALKEMMTQVTNVEKIWLVLGPSPLRPLHVYELHFPKGVLVSGDFARSKVADTLSRKAIRTMISKDVGSKNYFSGPTKLFLLAKAPSCFNLPLHFLPKREFKQTRKLEPFRLRFRCRTHELPTNVQCTDFHPEATDSIWFQCRHIIKGLASGISPPED